jgi:hypothetical protein
MHIRAAPWQVVITLSQDRADRVAGGACFHGCYEIAITGQHVLAAQIADQDVAGSCEPALL